MAEAFALLAIRAFVAFLNRLEFACFNACVETGMRISVTGALRCL